MVLFDGGPLFDFYRVPYGQGLNSCAWMGEYHNSEALELVSASSLHLTEVHFSPTVLKGNFNLTPLTSEGHLIAYMWKKA